MNQPTRLKPLFHPGRLLVSPAALATLRANGVPVISVLLRHIAGDWGNVSDDDRQQNDLSIAAGLRLISVYRLPDRAEVCVTTEWNRSHTTIRLAGDMSAAPGPDDSMAGWGRQPPYIPTVISRRTSSRLQAARLMEGRHSRSLSLTATGDP